MDKKINFSLENRFLVFYIIAFLAAGCSGPSHNDHGPLASIEKHGNNAVTYTVTSEDFVENIDKIAITNLANDTLFYVPERKSQILSFPCKSCHTKELSKMVSEEPSGKKAHWNLKLNHATSAALTCLSCHNSDNIDALSMNTKKEVSFNQSQEICAQCHSTQYNDWLGGAHGKRLGGWAPPRISNTCVNCHNPHSPAFPSRWPARLNTVKIQEIDPN